MAEKIEKQNRLIKLRDQLNSGDISVEDVSPEDQRLLKALEAREERAVYLNCDHVFEDVTEERRRLIEERGIPGWIERRTEKEMKKPPEKRSPRLLNRITLWKTLKYEKCRNCGLLKVSNKEVDIQGEKGNG